MLDKQAIETMRPFEGPIPGQSLTNSPEGQQPYEGAPEYTGVRDASEAIWLSLLEKENLAVPYFGGRKTKVWGE